MLFIKKIAKLIRRFALFFNLRILLDKYSLKYVGISESYLEEEETEPYEI